MIASGAGDSPRLRAVLAKHWLLCGRLSQAEELVGDDISMQVRAAAAYLRGDIDTALPAFDAVLKLLRKEVGKRNIALPGLPGALHLLSVLRSPDPKAGKQADVLLEAAWRERHGFTDACDWFAPQETWQRQLDALIALRQSPAATNAPAEGQVRLAWLIAYEPKWHTLIVEPREQKRDAKGQWTRGRPVALKCLREDAASMPYLTEQDRNATAAIRMVPNYYGTAGYEVDGCKAALALVGHPHLSLREVPDARLELVRGEPELLVREECGRLKLALQPSIDAQAGAVRIEKEMPTRLRVYAINDEHRRHHRTRTGGAGAGPRTGAKGGWRTGIVDHRAIRHWRCDRRGSGRGRPPPVRAPAAS